MRGTVRQRWDDACLRAGVTVDWPRGGDPCSECYGVRVRELTLLLAVDCPTGRVAWCEPVCSFYRAADIVRAMRNAWISRGRAPDEVVVPLGWQSPRVLDFLDSMVVRIVPTRGVPNPKRVEACALRIRNALALVLPSPRSPSYFMGEMAAPNMARRKVRAEIGAETPRRWFPTHGKFLEALERAVAIADEGLCHSAREGGAR